MGFRNVENPETAFQWTWQIDVFLQKLAPWETQKPASVDQYLVTTISTALRFVHVSLISRVQGKFEFEGTFCNRW